MNQYLINSIKGLGMGAANVIPGVSGGTIALITGIFERLIQAIKSFDLTAIKLLFAGKIKELIQHIDLWFLLSVFTGVAISIFTFARLFDYLFSNFPIHIWAYFFGLILASVYFVGKTVKKWTLGPVVSFLAGTAIAVVIAILNPSRENDSIIYLLICGVVAACSMILPGLSGSFVLILMGNYQLVMIDSINTLNFKVLIPVVIGAGVGLLAFSYFLAWIFKNYRDITIASLTGFILGSLSIIWPWKVVLTTFVAKNGDVLPLVQKNVLPGQFSAQTGLPSHLLFAVLLIVCGIATIWIMEKMVEKKA